jgi:hypothetical protein
LGTPLSGDDLVTHGHWSSVIGHLLLVICF